MANASVNTIRIQGVDGDIADVTSNALDVNIAGGTSIDIGDVDIHLSGNVPILGGAGDVATGVLRITIADNDPHFGTVGTGADVDGTVHGQLRHIGNSLSGLATQSTLNTLSTNFNYLLQTEDAAHSSGNIGTVSFAVRNDTLASLVSDDGDYAPCQVNASGALYVDIADGGQLDALLDTIKADTEAIETAVEILDNAISGSEMQVDIVSGNVTNAGTFAVQSTLQAGSAAIGTLAANSGVDIGDVDVTSISAGTNIIGKVGHDITGMVSDGNNTVGTSAEQLNGATDDSYSQACKRVDLQAHFSNTGYILVGDSGIVTNLSGGGIKLNAGDFYSIDIDNVGDIYVLAEVNAEDIFFTYYT